MKKMIHRRVIVCLAVLVAVAVAAMVAGAVRIRIMPEERSGAFRPVATNDGGMRVLATCRGAHALRRVGVCRLLDPSFRAEVLERLRDPSFEWTTDRHASYPTTDQEVFVVPWLDAPMLRLLGATIVPGIARLFGVDASHLVLRDQFVVKYEPGAQSALDYHSDASFFSYVVQLNDLDEFEGGGTHFEHAYAPLSAPPGHVMLFVGRNRHAGARVTRGVRFILTGFVDLRAPRRVTEKLDAEMRRLGGVCPYETEFRRPFLRYNVRRLSERTGLRGEALLRELASSKVRVPDLDLRPLSRACDQWLRTRSAPTEHAARFLRGVLDTYAKSEL